jgi:glycerophosphoryl diester phosphodiesterase
LIRDLFFSGLADPWVSEVFAFPDRAMNDMPFFDVQGHRGARGLRPENTLPGFELALDLGVTSIETDIRLTRDGIPVLFHDARISDRICSHVTEEQVSDILVSELTFVQLRDYRADRNPNPQRFPDQHAFVGPFTRRFADTYGIDPWAIPSLAELFTLVGAYAGTMGEACGKTAAQRHGAAQVGFELELKAVPFELEAVGDDCDGSLEQRVLAEVERAFMVDRCRLRSFDHRSMQSLARMHPRVRTALLIGHTAPVQPEDLLAAADAEMYCPDYRFVDEAIVKRIHEAGRLIVPWTVNEPHAWERLVAWNVDGLTTDYPDQLLAWLQQRGIAVGRSL